MGYCKIGKLNDCGLVRDVIQDEDAAEEPHVGLDDEIGRNCMRDRTQSPAFNSNEDSNLWESVQSPICKNAKGMVPPPRLRPVRPLDSV